MNQHLLMETGSAHIRPLRLLSLSVRVCVCDGEKKKESLHLHCSDLRPRIYRSPPEIKPNHSIYDTLTEKK